MDYSPYVEYLETAWFYIPYLIYGYVFLTLLPKSLCRIKLYADAEYETNRGRYHRCYGPELCCHVLHDEENSAVKPKQRKAVTRVYPKRQAAPAEHTPTPSYVRRPLGASTLGQNHVNKIAKMFETGNATGASCTNSTALANRKINRVLPEIRMNSLEWEVESEQEPEITRQVISHNMNNNSKYFQNSNSANNKFKRNIVTIDRENIENVANLLNQDGAGSVLVQDTALWSKPPRRHSKPAASNAPLHTPASSLSSSTISDGTTSSATPSSIDISPAVSVESLPVRAETPPPTLRRLPLNMKSSLEDIFVAIAQSAESDEDYSRLEFTGCHTLSPVTSIDDILSQRRLSRPLSAYSISDLLNEESLGATTCAEAPKYAETLLLNGAANAAVASST